LATSNQVSIKQNFNEHCAKINGYMPPPLYVASGALVFIGSKILSGELGQYLPMHL
jgi:hypothetical protein